MGVVVLYPFPAGLCVGDVDNPRIGVPPPGQDWHKLAEAHASGDLGRTASGMRCR